MTSMSLNHITGQNFAYSLGVITTNIHNIAMQHMKLNVSEP